MKPRNKLETKIVELSSKFKPITNTQKRWAEKTIFDNYYILHFKNQNSKTAYCLECGVKFDNQKTKVQQCHSCKKKLIPFENYNSYDCFDEQYYSILDTIDNYQVIRIVNVRKYVHKMEPARYLHNEIARHFIDETGKKISIGKIDKSGYNRNNFKGSALEIRKYSKEQSRMDNYDGPIYPKYNLIPILKRNGFDISKDNYYLVWYVMSLITDNQFETLYKLGQFSFLRYYYDNRISKYYKTILLLYKLNYDVPINIIKDYLDYLEMLTFFGKNLLDKKYVCPNDIKEAHDKYVEKKRIFFTDQKIKKQKIEIKENNKIYKQKKNKFLNLKFQENDLVIQPLQSVKEFLIEGDTFSHCVFTNAYYNKNNSLILSARIGNKRIETVEVSLIDFTVKQSRGMFNKPTEWNSQIVSLVKSNMNKIKKLCIQ
jgi:hypothetical protein